MISMARPSPIAAHYMAGSPTLTPEKQKGPGAFDKGNDGSSIKACPGGTLKGKADRWPRTACRVN